MGPACQFSLPPCAGRPRLCHRRILPCPASPRRPAPHVEWLPSRLNSPCHQGPSLTPLNLALSSMALKPLTPSLPARPPLPSAPSAPIKGYESPRASPALFPSLPSSLAPSFALAMSSSCRHSLPLLRRIFASARAPVSTPLAPPRPAHRPPPSPVSTGEP
jgi:hypothetical protein